LNLSPFELNVVLSQFSISGLFAARVLADHFENVIIIHPEEWAAEGQLADNGGKKRPGVFQYEFLHLYQKFLGKALPKMFPDIEKELRNAGNGYVWITRIFKTANSLRF